ncbi:MAG: hypothetical protein FWC43_00095 [Planctomycetaceae bacterium]|nr:hypothetical protein [Planctomycetaceae bacterium]
MNRFVLLRHNTTENQFHWDFLFEETDACKTFSVPQEFAEEALKTGTLQCTATRLADHRLAYLDYEGKISGDRGFVWRLDSGTWQTIAETIHFTGRSCTGTIDLRNDLLMMTGEMRNEQQFMV